MRLLKRLSEAFGGSGHEDEVAKIVLGEPRPLCRKVSRDALGNVVGFKPGKGKHGLLGLLNADAKPIHVQTAAERR